MIDIKDDLKTLLDNSTPLVTLLGGKKFFWEPAPDEAVLPRITFLEDNNTDTFYADNIPLIAKITYQFGVFVNTKASSSLGPIVQELDKVLRSDGWTRELCQDGYDASRGTRIKILKYTTTVEEES